MECASCMNAMPSVLFRPCSHTVLCAACAVLLYSAARKQLLCPVCRAPVKRADALVQLW